MKMNPDTSPTPTPCRQLHRRTFLAYFALATMVLTAAPAVGDDPSAQINNELRGTWQVTLWSINGKELSRDDVEFKKLLFANDTFVMRGWEDRNTRSRQRARPLKWICWR